MDYFDDFGRIKTASENNNSPIIKSGYVSFTENSDFNFTDAADLSRKLANSDDVSKCFVKKTFEYLKGEETHDNNLCSVEKFQTSFKKSNGDIFELVVSILSDSTRFQEK